VLTQFDQSHALLEPEGPEFLPDSIGSKTFYDGFVDQREPRFPAVKEISEFLTAKQTISAASSIVTAG
jgi:hypothetical protein